MAKRGAKPGSDPWAKWRERLEHWKSRAEKAEAALLALLEDMEAATERARRIALPEAGES